MSPTASAVPDELLDDSAERPQARGPRRRTVSEGPAAGHEVLSNPTSARISRVAGLSRRNARTKHRRFLVEGPQGVREAVRHAPGRVLDVYLTGRPSSATAISGTRPWPPGSTCTSPPSRSWTP